MNKILVLLSAFIFFGTSLAQSELPQGVSIRILDPNEGLEFEIATELYLSPTFLAGEIGWNDTTTSLSISLSSQVNIEVLVVVDDSNLLISGNEIVQIRAGNRVSVSFTAYAPHDGVIRFINRDGEVVEEVPYRITKQNAYHQNISAGINFDGVVQANYSIRYPTNLGLSVNVGFDPATSSFTGGVSGSYSW